MIDANAGPLPGCADADVAEKANATLTAYNQQVTEPESGVTRAHLPMAVRCQPHRPGDVARLTPVHDHKTT